MVEILGFVQGKMCGMCVENVFDSYLFSLVLCDVEKIDVIFDIVLLDQAPLISEGYCSAVLSKFWNQYHIWVWQNKKNFSSFMGNELALFTANTSDTNEFLASNLVPTNKVSNIKDSLQMWQEIFHFLSITHLDNISDEQYQQKLHDFKSNVDDFYTFGSKTFLTSSEDKIGED